MDITFDQEISTSLDPSTLSKKWFNLYFDEFYRSAFSYIKDKKKSIDVIKDTFFTALGNLDTYEVINERKWLLQFLKQIIKKNKSDFSAKKNNQLMIENILNKMPVIQKKAFILKTYEKYNTKEICKKLSINEDKFWSYIHNSRKQLIEDKILLLN